MNDDMLSALNAALSGVHPIQGGREPALVKWARETGTDPRALARLVEQHRLRGLNDGQIADALRALGAPATRWTVGTLRKWGAAK